MMSPQIGLKQVALKRRAYPGDAHCGDQLEYWQDGERLICCVVDGLGHGLHAQDAACKIVAFVAQYYSEAPESLFTKCDKAMRHERGGVMAVAWIEGEQLIYASVGNITGHVLHVDDQGKHKLKLLNMDRGMIGGGFKKLNVRSYPLCEADLLIMHSDGLNPFYNLDPWQSAIEDVEKMATMLLQDQGKSTDDACVLVYRHGEVRDDG